jgi:NADH-quinone oxidoreductase subunit E
MLSEDERRQIEAQFSRYPQKRAVVPEALKTVQRSRGWVSDEAVGDIAELLSLTADEVDAVATFYNLIYRKPVGRHVILLCDSVSCWIMGYENLYEYLRSKLGIGMGQTTADNRFTLLPAPCLGACDQAPAMMVDEDLHGRLDAEKIDRILGSYP